MSVNVYSKARFLKSVAEISQLPEDQGLEIAFVGRSNAGKSSALNVLTQQKQLARTSKTPGRTRLINFFKLTDHLRLVELPGYGYAKVSWNIRQHWHQLLDQYLRQRKSLCGLVLLSDIRHSMQPFEKELLSWADQINLPVHILLTKADKLSRNQQKGILCQVQELLKKFKNDFSVQIFSSTKKTGVDDLTQRLDQWFYLNSVIVEKKE